MQEPSRLWAPGPGAGTVTSRMLLSRTWLMGRAGRGAPSSGAEAHLLDPSAPQSALL